MSIRKASAEWNGDLKSGKGQFHTGSGAVSGKYSFATRFEESPGTNPEELVGAAHAACFSMALSNDLAKAGFVPTSVKTDDKVHFEKVNDKPTISKIEIHCEAVVPKIDNATFQKIAEDTKINCPVSRALKTEFVLTAVLK
jgi:osmotically inducible protein OsmC